MYWFFFDGPLLIHLFSVSPTCCKTTAIADASHPNEVKLSKEKISTARYDGIHHVTGPSICGTTKSQCWVNPSSPRLVDSNGQGGAPKEDSVRIRTTNNRRQWHIKNLQVSSRILRTTGFAVQNQLQVFPLHSPNVSCCLHTTAPLVCDPAESPCIVDTKTTVEPFRFRETSLSTCKSKPTRQL